jgi:isoleucyl-tRNA synthetase
VLDIQLTEELLEEGFVREIISKVQTMRKEAGFEVMDKITISVAGNDKVADIMKRNEEAIFGDVLATAINYGAVDGYTKNWSINGEKVDLGVTKNA